MVSQIIKQNLSPEWDAIKVKMTYIHTYIQTHIHMVSQIIKQNLSPEWDAMKVKMSYIHTYIHIYIYT